MILFLAKVGAVTLFVLGTVCVTVLLGVLCLIVFGDGENE